MEEKIFEILNQILDEQKVMNSKIDAMMVEIAGLKEFQTEMQEFKTEMQEFKTEMQEFKTEMLDFKAEMTEFRTEMRVFKSQMKDYKYEMLGFVKRTDKTLDELDNRMYKVEIVTANNWGDLVRIRNECCK